MDIQAIKAKIKALFAKTVEAGCSEEESLAATRKAEEMLQKYQLENVDIMFESEEVGKTEYNTNSKQMSAVIALTCAAVAEYTNCRVWRQGPKVIFFGLETDRQLAYYLQDMIKNLCERDYKSYKRRNGPTTVHGRALRGAFEKGFAVRVSQKLNEMRKQAESERMAQSDSKALVVNKNALINREYNKLGMRLKSSTTKMKFRDNGAYQSGKAAGDRANISTGIGSRQKCAGMIAG